MANAKAAKDALDQAVTNYKFCKSGLSKTVSSEAPVSERSLSNKMNKLDSALQDLNSAHTAWLSKTELDDTALAAEKYSSTWLEKEWDEYETLHDQVDAKLSLLSLDSTPPTQSNTSKLQIFSKQMETLQLEIKTKIDQLSSRMSKSEEEAGESHKITQDSHKVYVKMLSSVKELLSNRYVELTDNILALDVARLDEFELFRQEQLSTTIRIELALAENAPASTSTSALASHKSNSKGIEMEKSKAPQFSGKIIDYPEFKRGWKQVAGVYWDDGNQLEQLKLKVDDHTRRIILRCKNMTEVWDALDKEYAQEQEVVNAVNKELSKLRSMDCSTEEYIVELRNFLPYLEDVLKEVDGLEHLQSPDRVNFMVDKFDERTLHEWEYFRSKQKGSTYARFFSFLLDRYEAARSVLARQDARLQLVSIHATTAGCTNCQLSDHTTEKCPHGRPLNHNYATNVSECHRCNKWTARDGVYTCPACGRGTLKDQKIPHCLEHCGHYMALTANERSQCIEKSNWCPIHLVGSHQLPDCNGKGDAKFICNIDGCQKHHHKTLHHSTTPFILKINSTSLSMTGNIITLVQSVTTISGSLVTFWDNGSTCSLISKAAANRLKLLGEPVRIGVETVTGTEVIDSFMYSVTLVDIAGDHHIVTVFAVETISNHLKSVEISRVKSEFSADIQKKWHLLHIPDGEVELLVGLNAFSLHPQDLECSGNLKVMQSRFGTGYLLGGSHPSLNSNSIEFSETVSNIRHSSHVINKISVKPSYEFFEGDIMGVQPPRRCGNCMKCKECKFISQRLSQEEQYQYRVMESKVYYDEERKCFRVLYPFTDNPRILPKNYAQVVRIAEREERKLIKESNLHRFNQEFDRMLEGGAIVELSKEEMASWDGPEHYVSLQHVIKEDSPTTPLRIVANSSLSDKHGVSLNSILMKGPNTLADSWEILNRWRMYPKAMCSDVTKAYWSLQTGEVEKHVRRIVWRYGDPTKPWRVFGICVVSFGDRCAATILEIAIKKTAQMNQAIDPLAALRIETDRYVDDIASGGTDEEVSRFVGDGSAENNGTVTQILSPSGLNLKTIVTSGETDPEKLQKLGNSVLGVGWNAPLDFVFIDFTNNLKYSITFLMKNKYTLKICLSITNSIYDPLGLVAPITIMFKVAFRDLFREGLTLSWDDHVPPEDQERWNVLVKMLISLKAVNFPRCTKSSGTKGRCQLICYFDGSDIAYASVIYIRWEMNDGSVFTTLVNCKSRTTPLQRISTPRSELNGAVMATRLVLSTLRSWSTSHELPERVWMIGDSECTLSSIEKASAAFGEFFGNRVGEVQENQAKIEEFCPVGLDGEWYYTESHNNAADIATRLGCTMDDIGLHSTYQNGYPYLRLPRAEWPINRDFASRKHDCIPQNELLKKFRCLIQATEIQDLPGINQLVSPYSTNDWNTLIKKTQLVLLKAQQFQCLLKSRTVRVDISDTAQRISEAKILWFRTAMNDTITAIGQGKLKELDIQEKNGLKVVVGRAQAGLRHFFGKDHLPVVMGGNRVAQLIMTTAHWADHAGRDITQAMARHEAWIVNAKHLAKKVIHACIRCRYIRKSLQLQKISILPESIQVQCPPFTNIGLDLTGPHIVKAMTNKRATMKVWVVLFLCLNTKAISIELAPGYSTKDFLLAYTCHISQRGAPLLVHSDRGSQLIAAHKEICDDPLRYDWDAIAATTSDQGTTWDFTPAGAQWRNGAAEAFVKKFKHSFYHLYQDSRLNYAELQCAVKRIANVLNHRPVSVQRTKTDTQDDDFLSPLTPNMLITGRSASSPPVDFIDSDDTQIRYSYIEELERAWWFQYKVQYFQSHSNSQVDRGQTKHSMWRRCPD